MRLESFGHLLQALGGFAAPFSVPWPPARSAVAACCAAVSACFCSELWQPVTAAIAIANAMSVIRCIVTILI